MGAAEIATVLCPSHVDCDVVLVSLYIANNENLSSLQIIKQELLKRGFEKLYGGKQEPQYDVADDVSLVELIVESVKVTEGVYTNS